MRRRSKISLAAGAALGGVGFAWAALGMPALGATPAGDRKVRMAASPNFHKGKARNLVDRPMAAEGSSMMSASWDFMFSRAQREPEVEIPVVRPDPAALAPQGERLRATWLGHSTVLLEVDGHLLITDPVFAERAAPVSFAGPKRFHAPPLALADLPPLDAVLISHDHYDHLDHGAIVALAETGVPFLVPLGVGAHLESWGVEPAQITELDWWEQSELGDLRLVCTPAHHFSGRSGVDRDRTLWSSWAIMGEQHRVWFGGDTGPLEAADLIAERYGPFDLTLIEIGAFDPAWAAIHLGPDEAVKLHQQVGGRVLLPIHWGSFNLALHAWDQPINRLQELAEQQGLSLMVPVPGGTMSTDDPGVAEFWRGRRD